MARFLSSVLLLIALGIAFDALGQPTPAPSSAPPPAPPSSAEAKPQPPAGPAAAELSAEKDAAAKKEQALAHFEKGVKLYDEGAWEPALAEYLASRRMYPTRSATKNAALCYRHLHRFAEALDMFERLMTDYPDLTAEDKTATEKTIQELRGLVGTIDLRDIQPGSRIVVDGVDIGTFPLAKPIRVSAGAHIIRAYKAGFAPFEIHVDVAAEATVVSMPLQLLTQSGLLRVSEQTGKVLDVLVDNVVVGKTPWEGPVSEGDHAVVLRGEGAIGTQPVSAPVKLNQPTVLTLLASELEASLRIELTPGGAVLALDSVNLGRGIWEGRLKAGTHSIEVAAEGFLMERREIVLGPGKQETLAIALKRDPSSELWQEGDLPKVAFELDGGFVISPSYGGDVAGDCGDGCSRSVGLGGLGMLQAGYEFGSGFGLGIQAGYFGAIQKVKGRAATLTPVGKPANTGTVDDSLLLRGLLLGAAASMNVGEDFPLLFRLGVGGLIGSLNDDRSGQFTSSGATPYETGTLSDSESANFLYLAPEARLGVRFADNFVVSASVTGYFLIGFSHPEWKNDQTIVAAQDGMTRFGAEQLAGELVVLIVPGLGLRYDFSP